MRPPPHYCESTRLSRRLLWHDGKRAVRPRMSRAIAWHYEESWECCEFAVWVFFLYPISLSLWLRVKQQHFSPQ